MKVKEAPDTIYASDDPVLLESIVNSAKDLPKEDLQLLDTLAKKLVLADEHVRLKKGNSENQ